MSRVGNWKQYVHGGIVTPRLFSADILTLSKRCVKTAESLSRGLVIPSISHTGRDGGEMKGRKSSLYLEKGKEGGWFES